MEKLKFGRTELEYLPLFREHPDMGDGPQEMASWNSLHENSEVFRYRTTCGPFSEPLGPPSPEITLIARLHVAQFRRDGSPDPAQTARVFQRLSYFCGFGKVTPMTKSFFDGLLIATFGVFKFPVPVAELITPWRDIAGIEMAGTARFMHFGALTVDWDIVSFSIPIAVDYTVRIHKICDYQGFVGLDDDEHRSGHSSIEIENETARKLVEEWIRDRRRTLRQLMQEMRETEAALLGEEEEQDPTPGGGGGD